MNEQSKKKPYKSRYGGGRISPASHVAEMMCERLAQKERVELPQRFWQSERWAKPYRVQTVHASRLIKEFGAQALLAALRTTRGSQLYSLGASDVVVPLVRAEQEKLNIKAKAAEVLAAAQAAEERKAVMAAEAWAATQPKPEPAEQDKTRPALATKASILSKLQDLDVKQTVPETPVPRTPAAQVALTTGGATTQADPLAMTLPDQLRAVPRWLCWRLHDGVTQPIDVRTGEPADITDPACWASFEDALAYFRQHSLGGVGLVLANDGYVAVNIDDCYDPDTKSFSESATNILQTLDSYCELSPSGTGVTAFVRALLPERTRTKNTVIIHGDGQFVPVTGRWLDVRRDGEPAPVEARQPELLKLFHELRDGQPVLTDEEVLSRARKAANAAKFKALWEGGTSGHGTHSNADLALCAMLGFWTQGDAEQVDRLFRQSRLMRKKWDNADYREPTIRQALAVLTGFFQPSPPAMLNRFNQVESGIINYRAVEYHTATLEQGMQMAGVLAESVSRNISNWQAAFLLARHFRKLTTTQPEQFEDAVKTFCEKTGRQFEEVWYDYLSVWEKVRYAEGDDPLTCAAALAKKEPYTNIPCLGPLYVEIASLAWHLSHMSNGKPFWLPRERLAELYRTYPMKVFRVVELLEQRGVIKCVCDKYDSRTGKAKEYIFTGPPVEEGAVAA